jgi:type I restriction enzyme S subunit
MSEVANQSGHGQDYEEVQFGPKTIILPSDWSTVRFGDVFHRRKESIEADGEGVVRYVGLKHLDSGQLQINGYEENGDERSSSRAFRTGDILFGKLRPNLNKAAIAPFDGICSSDIIPIYAEEETLQQYLPYLMHSKLIRDRVVSTMEGTNLPRTSWSDLEKTVVPLPPVSERRYIADVLSVVDEQIEQTDEIIKRTLELKEGVHQDLFTSGFYEHDNVTTRKLITAPDEWEIRALSEFTKESAYGPRFSSDQYQEDGNIATLRTTDLTDDGGINYQTMPLAELDPDEFRNHFLQEGDFVISRTGANCGICTVWEEFDTPTVPGAYMIRFRLTDGLNPHYLRDYINSPIGRKNVDVLARGSSQKNLAGSDLLSMTVPVPPRDEQDKIVEAGSRIYQQLREERQTKETLEELKEGLMQDLLTGKIRVNSED